MCLVRMTSGRLRGQLRELECPDGGRCRSSDSTTISGPSCNGPDGEPSNFCLTKHEWLISVLRTAHGGEVLDKMNESFCGNTKKCFGFGRERMSAVERSGGLNGKSGQSYSNFYTIEQCKIKCLNCWFNEKENCNHLNMLGCSALTLWQTKVGLFAAFTCFRMRLLICHKVENLYWIGLAKRWAVGGFSASAGFFLLEIILCLSQHKGRQKNPVNPDPCN